MVDKLPGDLEGMEATMERLLALIGDVYNYVDDVVEERVAPDNNTGRFISDTDHSLVLYLSSIARTQLGLAKTLNTAALSASPRLPTFAKMDSSALRVDCNGSIMLTFWPAVAERKYDWEKKQHFFYLQRRLDR